MSSLVDAFSGLRETSHRITSPVEDGYNCVAWAAGDTDRWWWPDASGVGYWPPGVGRVETVESFVAAFATLGFAPAGADADAAATERVAVFAAAGEPTHMARQLPGGRWTSKLGRGEDIEHELAGLEGRGYGRVVAVLARPRAAG